MFLRKINLKIKEKSAQRAGFTLLEMVVAVALFAIVILIVTNIFLIATKSHRRVMETQKLQSDARFAMETIAREVRMGTIDYDYYGGQITNVPVEILALWDINNSQVVFKSANYPICPDAESDPCLAVCDESENCNSITPVSVKLIRLKFYIDPQKNPFKLVNNQYEADAQPRVTIILDSRTVHPPQGEVVPEVIYLQTTVTSRVYKR